MNHDRNKYRGGRGGGGGKPTRMGGHVFQCHSEKSKRDQFEETLGDLETFASTKYVAPINYLTPIFINITQPTLTKPTLSIQNKL